MRRRGMGGGPTGGLPGGIDPQTLRVMTPQQLREMAEQMKKGTGR